MKIKLIIWLSAMGMVFNILWMGFSFYSLIRSEKPDTGIVLVENSRLKCYGTGFVVSRDDKSDIVATSFAVVASENGAPPKTAIIKNRSMVGEITGNVVYYDAEKNIALIKTASPIDSVKPLKLHRQADISGKIWLCGFEGSGNILTDYDSYNLTNTIRYVGTAVSESEKEIIFSKEFNRALMGGPACDAKGNVIGMCLYGNKNTGSAQYVVPSDLLADTIEAASLSFTDVDSENMKYASLFSAALGLELLCVIIFFAIMKIQKMDKIN